MMMDREDGLLMPNEGLVDPAGVPVEAEGARALPGREEIALEDMPIPTGFRILVEMLEVRTVTAGGVHISDESIEAQKYMCFIGGVVSMGPLCYNHRKFDGAGPWCQVGDWVAFGQNAGQSMTIKGRDFRLLNDENILALIPDPSVIKIYVE